MFLPDNLRYGVICGRKLELFFLIPFKVTFLREKTAFIDDFFKFFSCYLDKMTSSKYLSN